MCAKRALFMCALAGQATKNLRIDKTQFLHHEKVFRVSMIFFKVRVSVSRERERDNERWRCDDDESTTNRR